MLFQVIWNKISVGAVKDYVEADSLADAVLVWREHCALAAADEGVRSITVIQGRPVLRKIADPVG